MNYDCSVTNRQGCNYCTREKPIEKLGNILTINDKTKDIFVNITAHKCGIFFEINYCPICGRRL